MTVKEGTDDAPIDHSGECLMLFSRGELHLSPFSPLKDLIFSPLLLDGPQPKHMLDGA